jgi:hypothetical protein
MNMDWVISTGYPSGLTLIIFVTPSLNLCGLITKIVDNLMIIIPQVNQNVWATGGVVFVGQTGSYGNVVIT